VQLPQHRRPFRRQSGRAVSRPVPADQHHKSNTNSIKRYKEFKEFNKRICVATDVFGRGIDIERINLAINYDLPGDADSYLHRVGRAGRFGTKGLSISFVSSEADQDVLKAIEKRFEVALPSVLPFLISHALLLICHAASSLKAVSTRAPTWPTRGKRVLKDDGVAVRRVPSSKICSRCGSTKGDLISEYENAEGVGEVMLARSLHMQQRDVL